MNPKQTVEKRPYPKGHYSLRRCASSFVIATYNLKVTREKICLIPQDSHALHMSIFEQSESAEVDYGRDR